MFAFYRKGINIKKKFLISLILFLSFVNISAQIYVIGDAKIIAEKSIVATENLKNSLSSVTASSGESHNHKGSDKNSFKRKPYHKKNKTLTHRQYRRASGDHFQNVLQNFFKNTDDDRYFRQYDSFQKSLVLQNDSSKYGVAAKNDSRFDIIFLFERNKFFYTSTPVFYRSKEYFLTRPPPGFA